MDAHDLPSRALSHSAPMPTISPRLLASWQRSEDYGVSLDDVQPTFSGTYDDESLFVQCGTEILADLHSTLSSEPVGLMLTDADGLVLNRLSGDRQLLHALDEVHLAPGFSYSERQAGTNGLGLALADRVASLVRAKDHYALSLRLYACAAAPVFDPVSGRLEGAVNLTTWSEKGSDLLLALAQTAATSTTNLMLARSQGHHPRRVSRGQVFRIEGLREQSGNAPLHDLSDAWNDAVARAVEALTAGRMVAAVGERGSGRATLLAQAVRQVRPHDRLLAVHAPAPHDVDSWFSVWTPELNRPNTGFVLCDVDHLSSSAAQRIRGMLVGERTSEASACPVSAEHFDAIPLALRALVATVVQVPPLRERSADILPLANHLAWRVRRREVDFTTAASRALTDYAWPGNVEELAQVVKEAASRTDVVDVRHLPPQMLSHSEHLSRIKAFERDEIVRVLSRPGATSEGAAAELGMSRATVYRKLAQYGIQLPRRD